ncbi:MAG: hypothetical protein KC609_16985 [Myxococcales bacterium]|nr:hypothetical protein [Myxococcales bacterium]
MGRSDDRRQGQGSSAELDELDRFESGQRRGRLLGVVVTLVVLAGVGGAAYFFLGGFDAHTVCRRADLKAFYQLPSPRALEAVHSVCRFEGRLGTMLEGISSYPSSMRKLLIARYLASDLAVLNAICGASGPRVLASAMINSPANQARAIVAGCKMGALGAATADELGRVDLDRLLVGAAVFVYLKEKKDSAAKRVARHIWGL